MDILRGVYTFTKISQVTVTAPIFRLHCNATVVLLLTFSIAVTTREYVGNPIDCVYSNRVSGSIPEDTLNTYCWIHSTYTVTDALGKIPGRQVAYPGVTNSEGDPAAVKHVKYYQWVAFVLFFQLSKHTLDGSIFKLHIFTCGLLLAFALILVTSQLCGANIHCDNKRINQNVLDSFCWIHGTYSVMNGYNKTVGRQVPYPGVMPTFGNDEELRHHKYYQWTVTIIMAQAILFYTPRWLWKSWEGGKIHALMMDLDIGICTDIEKKQKKKLMIDYLWENLRFHNWWAYKYYFCELLALVNVIGQMFLMNRFFDGAFLTFGIEVIQFMDNDEEDRVDPMIKIFPRMTKCTFYKYGVSGEIEKHDAICILPLNVVNEKIYVFLWFWFIILTCLTFLTVVYRIIIIFSPRMRVYLLRMRYRLVRKDAIDLIVRRSKMGDWFLFYMLGENVDSVIFRDVLQELANKLGSNPSHHMSGPRGDMMDA